MSDRRFFTAVIIGAALLWGLLQTTVYAAQPAPEPIRYTAAVGVAITADPEIYVQEETK